MSPRAVVAIRASRVASARRDIFPPQKKNFGRGRAAGRQQMGTHAARMTSKTMKTTTISGRAPRSRSPTRRRRSPPPSRDVLVAEDSTSEDERERCTTTTILILDGRCAAEASCDESTRARRASRRGRGERGARRGVASGRARRGGRAGSRSRGRGGVWRRMEKSVVREIRAFKQRSARDRFVRTNGRCTVPGARSGARAIDARLSRRASRLRPAPDAKAVEEAVPAPDGAVRDRGGDARAVCDRVGRGGGADGWGEGGGWLKGRARL